MGFAKNQLQGLNVPNGDSGKLGFKLFDILRKKHQAFAFLDVAQILPVLLVAAYNSTCKSIHSIEPNPRVYAQLGDNTQYNHPDQSEKIHLHNCAIDHNKKDLHALHEFRQPGEGQSPWTRR